MTLRTYTGGYLRYEGDNYRGGNNPWTIATLWMAMYYRQAGNRKAAEECIKFVVDTASDLGFLAEQVDNQTKQGTWETCVIMYMGHNDVDLVMSFLWKDTLPSCFKDSSLVTLQVSY